MPSPASKPHEVSGPWHRLCSSNLPTLISESLTNGWPSKVISFKYLRKSSLDHLGDDFGRLALLSRPVRIEIFVPFRQDSAGTSSADMQLGLLAAICMARSFSQFVLSVLDIDKNTNFVSVQIAADPTLRGRMTTKSTNRNIFTNLGHELRTRFFQSSAGRQPLNAISASTSAGSFARTNSAACLANFLKVFVLGNEIRFAIDLDRDGGAIANRQLDTTLLRQPGRIYFAPTPGRACAIIP